MEAVDGWGASKVVLSLILSIEVGVKQWLVGRGYWWRDGSGYGLGVGDVLRVWSFR